MTSTRASLRAIGLAVLGVAAGIAGSAPPARAQGDLPQCKGAPATWNGCVGTRRDRDGGEYTGEWRNGRRHGRGTYAYANGDRYEGDYTDDRQTGSGTYVTRDGERQSGRFTDGQRDGYFTVIGANGQRSTVNYRNGAPTNLSGAGGAGPREAGPAGAGGRAASPYGPGAAAGVSAGRVGGQVAVGAMAAQGGQYMQAGRNDNHDGYTGQPSGPAGRPGARGNAYAPQGSQLSPGAEPARTQVASAGAAPARPAPAQGAGVTQASRTTGAQPAAVVAAPAPAKVAPTPAVFGVPTSERKVALVIGNSAYAHANPLPNPKNDANDMAKMLKGLGFTVVSGTDLGHDAMAKTIRAFMAEAQSADVALFFYAGHGIQVSGQNYLIPVDAKVEDSSALDFELVNIDAVTGHMGGENKVGIILLDACRNNPFANSLTRNSGTRAVQVSKGLAQISSQGGGLLVAFATAPGDVAADGKAGRNSPFTTALLEQMPTPGLEIELMMKRVKAEVIADTGNAQRPWHNSDLAREVYLTQAKN